MTNSYELKRRLQESELKGVWKSAGFGGVAGLKHTAVKISNHIPKCKLYVEPFAGKAQVAKYVRSESKILNDKSEISNKYCNSEYPNAVIENLDFEETISKYDSEDTFFLFDPPWHGSTYAINENTFIDRKPIEYFKRLLEIVPNLKANWFITSSSYRNDYQLLIKTDWNHKIVESDKKVLFGKKAKTMITARDTLIELIHERLTE